ncbi:N-acetyl-gamma-glutamyl-phosphate reductase [Humidisolicoccus flavus]|uniref:N-acetyl-gamma-glutamyl-phosphate reductase n=1 Tax=Humidisolicoccus flavus TaxID=3111414 RepID=UPI00324837C4
MPLSVAVAGASGYAGGELLRLLSAHPEFDVVTVTANANAGKPLLDVHPGLRSLAHLALVETSAERLDGHDVVFLALPHGHSAALSAQLPAETLVIDCGADHRLESAEDWEAFYGEGYGGSWPYGMPELIVENGTQRRELRGARRIAVPGCNVTAVTLGLAPGIAADIIDPTDIVATLAVGPSGAGRALKTNLLASELLGSAEAYAVGGVHRHIPEIHQNLKKAGAAQVSLSFTPILIPAARGILASITAPVREGVTAEDLYSAWSLAYAHEPFVHVVAPGTFPRTADVLGSNAALIGVTLDEKAGRAVIITAIDNLGKGTAGAAVQSANIALGFEETLGLSVDGVAP